MQLLGVSGSLREGSFNTWLLRHAVSILPDEVEMRLFDLSPIPLYNQDVELAALPDPVVEFKDAIERADGVFISSPEYNHGMSGVLKNALDWQSRPRGQASITGKPIAFATVSAGPTGGVRAQGDLKRVLAANSPVLFPFPEFAMPSARDKFDEQGRLTDAFALDQLPRMLEGFIDFILRVSRPVDPT